MPPAHRIPVQGTWWRINRAGGDPFLWTPSPADGRWQRGAVIRGFYLADSEDTLWAEWYRHTSELGVPPATRMPRDTWRIAVDVTDIADLSDIATLSRHGISELQPTRKQWAVTQAVGEMYHLAGYRGILTPSAAHVGGQVLTIFRLSADMRGLVTAPPATTHNELPPLPTGLRT